MFFVLMVDYGGYSVTIHVSGMTPVGAFLIFVQHRATNKFKRIAKMKKTFFALFYTAISLFCTLGYAHAQFKLPTNAQADITAAYEKNKMLKTGTKADYIPELAKADPSLFGIAVVTVNGDVLTAGDADAVFSIQSIIKPFLYGLALEDNGEQVLFEKVGLNMTGDVFNSVAAIERNPTHFQNPMVNAGAMQVTSLIKGKDSEEKWHRVLSLVQKMGNGKAYLGEQVYQSEMSTNQHNKAIAYLMDSYGLMYSNPDDALARYTKGCSIMVSTRELAILGATLANGGVNPITHQSIFQHKYVTDILSSMAVHGLYQSTGTWMSNVGLPAKNGVSGGLLAIAPNKMAIVVFSPLLDDAAISVKGKAVIQELSAKWNLHVFSTGDL